MRPGTLRVKLLALRHLSWLSERELGRLVAVANFITDRCPARPDPRESKETAASMVNPPACGRQGLVEAHTCHVPS